MATSDQYCLEDHSNLRNVVSHLNKLLQMQTLACADLAIICLSEHELSVQMNGGARPYVN